MDLGPLGLKMCVFVWVFGQGTLGFGTIAVFEFLVIVRCHSGSCLVPGGREPVSMGQGLGVRSSEKPAQNPGYILEVEAVRRGFLVGQGPGTRASKNHEPVAR